MSRQEIEQAFHRIETVRLRLEFPKFSANVPILWVALLRRWPAVGALEQEISFQRCEPLFVCSWHFSDLTGLADDARC
jgi:hypothetical protein